MPKSAKTTLRIDAATKARLAAYCDSAGIALSSFYALAANAVLDALGAVDVSRFGVQSVPTGVDAGPPSPPDAGSPSPAPFDRQAFLNKHVRPTDDDVAIALIEELADSFRESPTDPDLVVILTTRRADIQRTLSRHRTQLAQNQPVAGATIQLPDTAIGR